MKGPTENDGTCTITFNTQAENLAAPDRKKWLPCEACHDLQAVELNVVATYCAACACTANGRFVGGHCFIYDADSDGFCACGLRDPHYDEMHSGEFEAAP